VQALRISVVCRIRPAMLSVSGLMRIVAGIPLSSPQEDSKGCKSLKFPEPKFLINCSLRDPSRHSSGLKKMMRCDAQNLVIRNYPRRRMNQSV
jgi:hypothetical protein